MTRAQKATNEQIIAAYYETGSVWRAAEKLGMAGQTVHGRLKSLGHKVGTRWTNDEIDRLTQLAGKRTIGQISDALGRSYASVACKLGDLELSGYIPPPTKIPRGQGYDKVSIRKHMKAIDESEKTIASHARANGLNVETLIRAIERSYPEWWISYRESHTDLAETQCPYCGKNFYPSTKKQTYCSRRCADQRRTDESYFGGNRRNTIGLAERTCQICGRSDIPGLSSHHMLGKQNDPDNEHLIALCQGCHKIITMLGARTWTAEQWEAIVSLSIIRRQGPEIAAQTAPDNLEVFVEIDQYDDEEICDTEPEPNSS